MLLNKGIQSAIVSRPGTNKEQPGASVEFAAGGERQMGVSLRQSLTEVSDPLHLDQSVEEVFQTMLGVSCRRVPNVDVQESAKQEPDSVTSVVGFGGLLSGACVFLTGAAAAIDIAARMTGMSFDEIDDTVKDAVGEICNMLAGAWKGKVPELAANCGLSVPAVITGRDYKLRVQAPEFQIHHVYSFEGYTFAVTIVCDGLK
jgi:chemotaxis protein CheX